jgi:hypothetical protein
MTAGGGFLSSGPGPTSAERSELSRAPSATTAINQAHASLGSDGGLSPASGNRALARALAGAAASRTLELAEPAATRTLARCPGCGGRCGGTCGQTHSEPDEELLASGQRALRRAVLARRALVSPRS